MKRPTAADLRRAAGALRTILATFDPAADAPADRVVRRHIEGAVSASEVAAGDRPRKD